MTGLVRQFFISLCCFVLCNGAIAASAGERLSRISDVRFGAADDLTRIVVEIDNPVEFHHFGIAQGEPRIVLEMPLVRWSIKGLTSEAGKGDGFGIVSDYRYQHNSASSSRLILDLKDPAVVVSAFIMKPDSETRSHRIVVDLKRSNLQEYRQMASLVDEAPALKPPPRRMTAARDTVSDKRRKPMIVIDAGHGGKDPGAIGIHGHQEKDVTLSMALALADSLRKSGRYDVALTRGSDVFIELEDRVARARGFKADLFISLHADAGKKKTTRGASVYTLSASGERRQETMRETQNWRLDVEENEERAPDVNIALASLVETETRNQSVKFAQMLTPNIEAVNWPTLTNTNRNAGFYVLLAPDVPAVLLEMGFMTNPEDVALLTSERDRRRLLKGIKKSIDSFFVKKELYARR